MERGKRWEHFAENREKKHVQTHGLVYHLFPHVLMTRYNLHGETSKVLITFQISSFFLWISISVVFNQHFNYLSIFGPQGPPQEPRCHVGCTYWISPWWEYHLTRLAIACHRAFSGCFKPIKVPKPPQHTRPWCFWIDPSTSYFPDWSSKKTRSDPCP